MAPWQEKKAAADQEKELRAARQELTELRLQLAATKKAQVDAENEREEQKQATAAKESRINTTLKTMAVATESKPVGFITIQDYPTFFYLLQHVVSKLGLGLSPSRQTVIRHNDSTVIRCYVRPYSPPHYAPSLVLSNSISSELCWFSTPAKRLSYVYDVVKLGEDSLLSLCA